MLLTALIRALVDTGSLATTPSILSRAGLASYMGSARYIHVCSSRHLLFAFASSVVVTAPTHAWQPATPAQPNTHAIVSPNQSLELARLVDLAAARLDVRLEYDPQVLVGSVALQLPEGLRDEELWALTNQLLAQRGLTTIRMSGATALSVVKASEAAGLASVEVAGVPGMASSQQKFLPGFASRGFVVSGGDTRAAAEAIKPLLTKGIGNTMTLGESGMIVVSDYSAKLQEIAAVLQRVDAPKSSGVVLDEYAAQQMQPGALATLVMQIASKQQAAGGAKLAGELIASTTDASVIIIAPQGTIAAWRELLTRFDKAEAMQTRDYRPQAFATQDVANLVEQLLAGQPQRGATPSYRMVIDELTGTLILTAPLTSHELVRKLLERLDANDAGPRPMRAFAIRNRPVEDVLSTLTNLIDSGALEAGEAGTPGLQSQGSNSQARSVRDAANQTTFRDVRTGTAPLLPETPGATLKTQTRTGSNLQLTADEATNSLIAIGEARLLNQLESLLKMLDVRQPQVMLEVVLVSITDTQAKNLGIELEKLGNVGDASYKLASLFGLSSAGNGVRNVGDATGFTGAVLNPGEFSVVVRALEAVNLGRSMSNPKLLVTNNEQARFSSVLSQPFVRTDTTSNTATSSFGGSDSAGTTISVRPQIAQGDDLVLTYSINLSSFVGTPAAAGLPPPKQQNNVDSIVTIPDGHVVAVGGLELESDSLSTSQVPIVGDIPLIGELFKSRAKGKSRNRFFAFIKASVLRSESFADLRYISEKEASSLQIPTGWPSVEPRLIVDQP